MSQVEDKSGRSRKLRSEAQRDVVRSQRPHRKLYQKKEPTGRWPLKLIVAHRLGVEKKTLTQLKVSIESLGSLGD
jgi:hypothetical protein